MIGTNHPIPLGDFLLQHPLGRGAMGEVWAGVHRAQDTPVAVKILTGAVAERAGYALSFRQEVRAVAGLDHPNIVTVYDFGHVPAATAEASRGRYPEGRPYLVMELVDGGSLAARRGNLEWSELYGILLGLLDALGHAHARELIHRDLKPHNVMMPMGPNQPTIKLTDFGLAHALDRHADDPWREHLAGTPNYMAPEQIECRWRDYGPWTDLYAFGCLAWSLVTGVPPFAARDPREVMRNQVRRPPPRMSAELLLKKGAPAGFDAWLLRLLEKDPARRYLRAADAAWALLNLTEGQAPLSADEAAPTQWNLPAIKRGDPAPEDVAAYSQARALTWTVEDLSSVSDGLDGASPEVPPMPSAWQRPDEVRWQPLVGAGLGLYGLRAVPLVDRHTERDRLWRALSRVHRDGLPRAVVLRGAPGLGKSHLARWLCERAHEVGAAMVLKASHGPQSTPHDGLAPMIGRFHGCDDLNRSAVVDRMVRVLDVLAPAEPALLTESAHLIAEFITSGRAGFGQAMPQAKRFAVLTEHLHRLGRQRPLVLWIDDAQWGEEAVEFGRHLLEEAADVRALLVYTVRADTAVAPAAVEALERHPATERITVGPVPPEHMPDLIHALLGLESDAAAQVEERCEGNPLFAVQLVGDWVQRGALVPGVQGFDLRAGIKVGIPDGVHALWRQRLEEALPDPIERQTLEVAAMIGQTFEHGLLGRALRVAGMRVDPAFLDRLADRGLMGRDGRLEDPRWTFSHGMLRESLERQAEEAGRLQQIHLWCAEALAGERVRGYPERRARHFIAGGVLKPALELLITAGHEALDDGKPAKATALLQEWTRLAHQLDLPPGNWRRGTGRMLSRRIALVEKDYDRVTRLARAALREGEEYGWERVVIRALVDLGWAANRAGDWDVALARFTSALERARARHKSSLLTAARNMALILLDRGSFDEVMGYLDEVVGLIGDRPLHHAGGLTQVNRALLLRRYQRYEDAAKALDAAERHFAAGELRWGLARVLTERGVLALDRGDIPLALRLLEESAGRHAVIGGPNAVWARLSLARARLAAGAVDHAREEFEDELLESRNADHEAAELVAELGLLIAAARQRDWKDWSKRLSSVRRRIEVRESATRDAITMIEQAAAAAKMAGSDPRAAAALQVAETMWAMLGVAHEVKRVQTEIATLRPNSAKG